MGCGNGFAWVGVLTCLTHWPKPCLLSMPLLAGFVAMGPISSLCEFGEGKCCICNAGVHAIVAFLVPAMLTLGGVYYFCSSGRPTNRQLTVPVQPQQLECLNGSGTMTKDGSAAEYVPLSKASVHV